MRARVREAIERADVRGRESLDRFLEMLEARARAQGKVTALEVEPGIAMIELHSKDPEEVSRFSERMQRLQEEFARAGAKPDGGASPTPEDLLSRMAQAKNDSDKQALVRQFLQTVSELPAERQAHALERLNAVAGSKIAPPDSATLDASYQAIETAKDEVARQDFIREYLELVSELPDRERDERLARLNARWGRSETP
jgi:hypothetical protein